MEIADVFYRWADRVLERQRIAEDAGSADTGELAKLRQRYLEWAWDAEQRASAISESMVRDYWLRGKDEFDARAVGCRELADDEYAACANEAWDAAMGNQR